MNMAKNYYSLGGTKRREFRHSVLNKYDSKCAYCGCELSINSLRLDHIIPVKRGEFKATKNSELLNDFNPCCNSCNSSKGALSIKDWKKIIISRLDNLVDSNYNLRLLVVLDIIRMTDTRILFYYEKLNQNG